MGSASAETTLGPVGHIGLVVSDLDAAMAALAETGVRWSSVITPVARMRLADGRLEESTVRYVTASGQEPRMKIIEGPGTGYFRPPAGELAVHHLAHWVDDLEQATAALVERGYVVEATGEEPDGSARFRYLMAPGLIRVELGLRVNRAEFDAWADADLQD